MIYRAKGNIGNVFGLMNAKYLIPFMKWSILQISKTLLIAFMNCKILERNFLSLQIKGDFASLKVSFRIYL